MSKNVLSNKGKDKLLNGIENYIDAKIAISFDVTKGTEEEKQKKLNDSRDELKELLYALEIEIK